MIDIALVVISVGLIFGAAQKVGFDLACFLSGKFVKKTSITIREEDGNTETVELTKTELHGFMKVLRKTRFGTLFDDRLGE